MSTFSGRVGCTGLFAASRVRTLYAARLDVILRASEVSDAQAVFAFPRPDAPYQAILSKTAWPAPCRRPSPRAYGPHKTLYNRFVRWSQRGVFQHIFAALAGEAGVPERVMIDATHLKTHRTAASLLQKGLFRAASVAPRAD